MSAANWLTLVGLVITNILVIGPMVTKYVKGRAQSDAVVPLKYIEQLQKGQSDYIINLEQRVKSVTELYRQSEARNADLETKLRQRSRLLEEYMYRLHEKGDEIDGDPQDAQR